MAFDILAYHKKNKDYYGDAPLEEVAKDVFTRGGYDKEYPDYDTWKKSSGVEPIVQEDTLRRQPPSFMDRLRGATSSVAPGESTILQRAVKDPLISAAKGALIGIPETVVGLADIPTMGYAGKGVDAILKAATGGGFKEANETFDSMLTPETQAAKKKVADAKGFFDTIIAAVQNPSSIVSTIAESAPSMVGGAVLGRTVMKGIGKAVGAEGITAAERTARAITAGAAGEGLVTAGQNTEQVRQQALDGTLTPAQVALMAGSGFATGLISRMSAGLANRLGIPDIDTILAGGGSGKEMVGVKGILKGLIGAAINEGALEELPQSAQEQMAQNLATGKPAMEGVAEAGAMGLLAGAGMGLIGGGVGVVKHKTSNDTHDTVLQKLKVGAAATQFIDEGLKTGSMAGKPFAVEDALQIIREAQKTGVYDDEDIDRFKERYPALRDGLNSVVVDNLMEKISQVSFNGPETDSKINASWLKNKEKQLSERDLLVGIGVPNIQGETLEPNQEYLDAADAKKQYDELHQPFMSNEETTNDIVEKINTTAAPSLKIEPRQDSISALKKDMADVKAKREEDVPAFIPEDTSVMDAVSKLEDSFQKTNQEVQNEPLQTETKIAAKPSEVINPLAAVKTSPAQALNVSPEKIVEPGAMPRVKFGQIVETAKGSGKVVGAISSRDKSVPIIELEDGKRVRLDTLEAPEVEGENVSSHEEATIKTDNLSDLIKKHDDTGEIGSTQELIDKLKDQDNLSDPLKAAIMDYDHAVKTDRDELGMRSGLPEAAGEKVLSILRNEVSANTPPEAGQATGEQSGPVNLGQKGGDASQAPEPTEIFIRKTGRKDLGRIQKSIAAVPAKEGYEVVYKPNAKEGKSLYYKKLKEKVIKVGQKPKQPTESKNLAQFIINIGKVRLGSFSSKTGTAWDRAHGMRGKDQSREMGVIKDVASINGKNSMDEAASMANAAGYRDREGKPFTDVTLFGELAEGDARNMLRPDLQESKINTEIERSENEWAEQRAAEYEQQEIDARAIQDSQERLKAVSIDEIEAQEGDLTEDELAFASRDADDFFAAIAANKPVEKQSEKLSPEEVKTKQAEIPGASEAETFSLTNPETDMSKHKNLSEQVTPKNAEMFGGDDKDTQYSIRGLYSQLEKVVTEKLTEMPSKIQSIPKWLERQNVKPAEMKWMGVEQWLADNQKDGRIDKQAFADFIRENQIETQEVVKGGKSHEELTQQYEEEGYSREEAERFASRSVVHGREGTKFSQYQLPGGENYREVLLTLPPTTRRGYFEKTGILEAYGEAKKHDYKSAHWDEPNVLMHVRMNDRTDADGNRVLFLEEVQSDWHQEGKKNGYGVSLPKPVKMSDGKYTLEFSDGYKMGEYDTEKSAMEGARKYPNKGIPYAPFANTWHEFGMKRMIRYAAENGYDKIAWTTGEQQAERYDLQKHFKEIAYVKYDKSPTPGIGIGEYHIEGILQNGKVHNFGTFKEEKLPDVVGKDLATKMVKGEGRRSESRIIGRAKGANIFTGLDLKVDGEGMKSFYDNLIPGFMNRYVKQWGAKVGESSVKTEEKGNWKDIDLTTPEGIKKLEQLGKVSVHSVTITDSMRESVMQGQPMFAKGEGGQFAMPTLPEVQEVFKGQEVTEVDGGFVIRTRGGQDLIIKSVDHISPNKMSLNIGYGQNALQNGSVIAGKYHNDTIELVKGVADKWTLSHESVHFMEDIGVLSTDEVNLLKAHIKNLVKDGKFKAVKNDDIGGAEDRANFLADAMTKEPKGLLGRIVNTIQDFIDKLVNAFGIRTVRGIVRNVKTGKIYGSIDNTSEKAYNYSEGDGNYGKVSEGNRESLRDNPGRNTGVPYQPTVTGIEKIGNVKTYIRKITTAYDAAQVAVQYLKKYPDEHFISLVLGKKGKLLHVYRHAIGLRGYSQASISGIIGEAINTPGAESIIVAHNHPSQQARFSPEDIKFTRELQNLAAGSGISVRDSLAVTMGSYASYEQSGGLGSSPVGDLPGSINIPLVERVFKGIHNGEKISASDQATEAAKKHIPNGGTLLLDGNNAVAWSIPLSDYRKIRGASQAELLRELEKRNARAIIVYSPSRPVEINEAANIKTFSNATGGEIKVLDIIDPQGSMADSGRLPSPNGNEFYSVQQDPLIDHWDTLERTKWDTMLYNIADKNIDAKDVVSAIKRFTKKEISESEDIKLKETAYSGRLDARVKAFMETEFNPVMESLARAGISRETFEEYLLMRHAKEANDYYRRNKGTPDGGSGVLDADVDAYFKTLDDTASRKMAPIAEKIDAITHKSAETLIEYGVESKNTIGAWFGSYEHYVPLSRDDDPVNGRIRQTGFSISGSSSARRQEGSDKPALNILANIAAQREKYLKRGEKNIIAKALYALAKENPNPEFWEVAKPQVVPKANVVTGELVPVLDESYKKEDMVIMSRQIGLDGEIIERGIRFNEKNARAARMALALKNLDLDSIGAVLGTMAKVTRYMASINTQYNPVFGITNFFRDLGTMALNLSTTPIAGKQALVLKGVGPAMMGISKALRNDFTSEQSKLFKEFQMHGGQTGYVDLYKTAEDRTDAIDKQLKLIEGKNPIRGLISWAGDALSNYNTSIENAVRLSAYEVGLANGMSKDKAAAMAKDLTVNFNRKGQWASQAGAMYAFFNASVQGTARMYETFKGPAGKKIIMGGILFGSAQALVLAAAGFGDDEPPDFVRERNIIIPIGGKKYVTIPMPLGFNVLPNIGRIPVEIALTGGKGADKKIASMLGVILETFNPMGSSGLSLQTIMPTIADPLVALAENKDWTGKTIYRENYNSLDPAPGPSRAKNTSTMLGRALSSALNLATGGSKYTPGYFSPTPDQIDYLIGQATGGIGREAGKISQTVQSLASGEELPAHKIPVAGRFYGNAEGSTHEGTQFYENIKKLNAHEREIKGRVKDGKPVSEYIKDNPEARFYKMANAIDGNVKKLKQRKEMLKQRNASKDYLLSIDNQITAQMKRLNEAVDRTTNL